MELDWKLCIGVSSSSPESDFGVILQNLKMISHCRKQCPPSKVRRIGMKQRLIWMNACIFWTASRPGIGINSQVESWKGWHNKHQAERIHQNLPLSAFDIKRLWSFVICFYKYNLSWGGCGSQYLSSVNARSIIFILKIMKYQWEYEKFCAKGSSIHTIFSKASLRDRALQIENNNEVFFSLVE